MDYDQRTAWLEYHAESDECDCGDGTVVRNIGEDRAAVLDSPDCSADSAENAQSKIERLEQELEEVKRERDELWEKFKQIEKVITEK